MKAIDWTDTEWPFNKSFHKCKKIEELMTKMKVCDLCGQNSWIDQHSFKMADLTCQASKFLHANGLLREASCHVYNVYISKTVKTNKCEMAPQYSTRQLIISNSIQRFWSKTWDIIHKHDIFFSWNMGHWGVITLKAMVDLKWMTYP